MKVINMLGINEKIERAVAVKLQDSFITPGEIKEVIKKSTESLAADVYSNMQEIEQQKYKLVEVGIQISNLAALVKTLQEGGDK